MNHEALCKAFCKDVDIYSVPMGFAVRTPFTRPDGDFLSFYVRKYAPTGEFRLEDDGGTVAFLESQGVDLDTDSRRDIFTSLLSEYRAEYDENEILIHSDRLREEELAPKSLIFVEMMLRIYDLLFLTSKRVTRSFKDDLGKLISETFMQGHTIEQDAFFNESTKDYIADYIIRDSSGKSLAIFVGNSDLKALEALLFSREMRERKITNLNAMIVLETPKPQAIKNRTLSRVQNSGLFLGTYENEHEALAEKMERTLEAA
jgi:Domain of unknown function DUF1828